MRPLNELATHRSRLVLNGAVESARKHLGMDVAYIAAMNDLDQVYVRLAGDLPVGVHEGMIFPREQTCAAACSTGRRHR